MAQRTQLDDANNPLHEAYACLLANGLDGAGEALRILVNEASRIERAQYLQASPYERSAQRVDYANGYKSKTVLTRLGDVTFEVPQVRSGGFYPSALERGSRSEQAMNLALAEMYVQGVSTRKVITVLQKLVGPEISISSTQISRCTALLDEGLQAWRTRPLDETPYVILDARYERVRHANQVVDCAVLVAIGITATGHRRVLAGLSSLPAMTMRALKRHAKRCFPVCHGSVASFTCNTTRRAMSVSSISVRRWPARYGAYSIPATPMRLSACSTWLSKSGR